MIELHPGQVLGQREQRRRLERGRHGLAGIDLAVEHDAVDGRADHGLADVGLDGREARLGLRDLCGGTRLVGPRPLDRASCESSSWREGTRPPLSSRTCWSRASSACASSIVACACRRLASADSSAARACAACASSFSVLTRAST